MLIGAIIALLVIFGLFLSMLGASPQSRPDTEASFDTDSVKELPTSDTSDSLQPAS